MQQSSKHDLDSMQEMQIALESLVQKMDRIPEHEPMETKALSKPSKMELMLCLDL